MRSFEYKEEWKKLLTPEIVMYLTQIHEFKGEQTLFIEAKADTLSQLVDIAKIQSTEASNKIEGIYTSDERLKALVKDSTRPRTRNEREIAGYRDVLNTIHENHDYIPPKPSIILQLHRDLYKFEGWILEAGIKHLIILLKNRTQREINLSDSDRCRHGKHRRQLKNYVSHMMKH